MRLETLPRSEVSKKFCVWESKVFVAVQSDLPSKNDWEGSWLLAIRRWEETFLPKINEFINFRAKNSGIPTPGTETGGSSKRIHDPLLLRSMGKLSHVADTLSKTMCFSHQFESTFSRGGGPGNGSWESWRRWWLCQWLYHFLLCAMLNSLELYSFF